MSEFLEKKRRALMGGNSWLLTSGVTWDDVVAAYLFTARPDMDARLMNIAPGPSYPLTLSNASLTDSGLLVTAGNNRGANNNDVNAQPIRAGIIAASGIPSSGMMMLCYPHGSVGYGFGLASGAAMQYMNSSDTEATRLSRSVPCLIKSNQYLYADIYHTDRFRSGVLGGNYNGNIYVDGVEKSAGEESRQTSATSRQCGGTYRTIGTGWYGYMTGDNANVSSFTCQMAVFYKKALTAEQHADIAAKIRTRLGLS